MDGAPQRIQQRLGSPKTRSRRLRRQFAPDCPAQTRGEADERVRQWFNVVGTPLRKPLADVPNADDGVDPFGRMQLP